MTYNERDSIRATIDGFFGTGLVDEVLVVNNNAAPGTSDEVAVTAAREVVETRQGYGWASRRGLREARGDLLVLAEPDKWVAKLPLLPGRYRYRFIVDGQWLTDPHNEKTEVNEYGELNNVVEVA